MPAGADGASRLARRVRTLAVDIGERNVLRPKSLAAAAAYVRDAFTEAGYEPSVQTYDVPSFWRAGPTTASNIVAVLPGPDGSCPVFVVGAHYDCVPGTPGADDNASGVAALLELAARLRPDPGAVEIRFAAFDTEEPPFFGGRHMGSFHYARALRQEGRRVSGMLSLEMLGFYSEEPSSQRYPPPLNLIYPDKADFIAVVSNLTSRRFLGQVRKAFRPPGGTKVIAAALPAIFTAISLSDHYSFWRHGFPAAMVTDTAFLRYAHYHEPADLPEKLDFHRMADVVDGLEAALLALTR